MEKEAILHIPLSQFAFAEKRRPAGNKNPL